MAYIVSVGVFSNAIHLGEKIMDLDQILKKRDFFFKRKR